MGQTADCERRKGHFCCRKSNTDLLLFLLCFLMHFAPLKTTQRREGKGSKGRKADTDSENNTFLRRSVKTLNDIISETNLKIKVDASASKPCSASSCFFLSILCFISRWKLVDTSSKMDNSDKNQWECFFPLFDHRILCTRGIYSDIINYLQRENTFHCHSNLSTGS